MARKKNIEKEIFPLREVSTGTIHYFDFEVDKRDALKQLTEDGSYRFAEVDGGGFAKPKVTIESKPEGESKPKEQARPLRHERNKRVSEAKTIVTEEKVEEKVEE